MYYIFINGYCAHYTTYYLSLIHIYNIASLNEQMDASRENVVKSMEDVASVSTETAAASEEVSASAEEVNATTVSYTHLDVYKRQERT